MEEVATWAENHHPILRLKKYLIHRGLWDEERDTTLTDTAEADIKVGSCHSEWEGGSTFLFPHLPGRHAASQEGEAASYGVPVH